MNTDISLKPLAEELANAYERYDWRSRVIHDLAYFGVALNEQLQSVSNWQMAVLLINGGVFRDTFLNPGQQKDFQDMVQAATTRLNAALQPGPGGAALSTMLNKLQLPPK